MTFLTAPPSSQPTMSGFVYGRKYGVWQAACSGSARSASAQAITVAAGCSSAISRARFGPESTATRSGAGAGDLADHLAHPLGRAELDALHQRQQGGVARAAAAPTPSRLSRSDCDGTASTTMSASSSASAGVRRGAHRRRAAGCPGR